MVHPIEESNIPPDIEENDLTLFRKHPLQMISSHNGDNNKFKANTLMRVIAAGRPHGKAE